MALGADQARCEGIQSKSCSMVTRCGARYSVGARLGRALLVGSALAVLMLPSAEAFSPVGLPALHQLRGSVHDLDPRRALAGPPREFQRSPGTSTTEASPTTGSIDTEVDAPLDALEEGGFQTVVIPPLAGESLVPAVPATRLINGLMAGGLITALLMSFLTVDSEIWRGWTLTEVALRLLPDSWKAYEDALEVDPVAVKAAITAATYFIGDWLAQSIELKSLYPNAPGAWLEADITRLWRGCFIGAPLGILAHYYYGFSDSVLAEWPFIAKIVLDQTAYLFVYNSCYFLGTGVMSGKSPISAFQDYRTKAWKLMTAGWKLWPLVGLITYTIIPLRHRLLWVDAIEIVYSAILSSLSNDGGFEEGEETAPAESEL